MIGIYDDNFLQYLKDNLGDQIKITSRNIIAPCPFCEYNKKKGHYHLYISLEAPIFHCFHASCEQSGNLRKLFKKIEGRDISDNFIDKEKLQEFAKKRRVIVDDIKYQVNLPSINIGEFPYKEMYLKKRFKFANINPQTIKGLIFDVHRFIDMNNIPVDERLFRLRDYLHTNFVGFLTTNNTTAIFRNIDHNQSFKFFKIKIYETSFLDYYRLPGNDINSKVVVLAEGIFDIFSEHIYDHLNLKDKVKLYASTLSSNYKSMIHSIAFHDRVFRPRIIILSDRGIELPVYKKLKHFNKHIIDTLTIYYNMAGKDFNDTPVLPRKFVI